jgi:hypothetical protein
VLQNPDKTSIRYEKRAVLSVGRSVVGGGVRLARRRACLHGGDDRSWERLRSHAFPHE